MTWKTVNITLKLLLISGFFVSIVFNLENTAGKGMEFRAPFFILGAFFVYFYARAKKVFPLPHKADAIFTIPFLLDTYGNIFGLFDSFRWYDDSIHALNWICFVAVFQLFNAHKCSDNKTAFILGSGFGALLIIFWEIAEWVASVDGIFGVAGLKLSYEDTVGDLVTSTLGGVIGSVIGLYASTKKKLI
jgi:hypothetical protein